MPVEMADDTASYAESEADAGQLWDGPSLAVVGDTLSFGGATSPKPARSQVSRALPGNALTAGGPGDRPSALLSGISGDDDTFLSTVGPLGEHTSAAVPSLRAVKVPQGALLVPQVSLTSRQGEPMGREGDISVIIAQHGSPAVSRVDAVATEGTAANGWAVSGRFDPEHAVRERTQGLDFSPRAGVLRLKPGFEPAISESSAARGRPGVAPFARPEASEESSAGVCAARPSSPSVSRARTEHAVFSPLPSTLAVDLGTHGETGHARASFGRNSAEGAAVPSTPMGGLGPGDGETGRLLQAQMSAINGRRSGGRGAGEGGEAAMQRADWHTTDDRVLKLNIEKPEAPRTKAPGSPMAEQLHPEASAENYRRLSDAQCRGDEGEEQHMSAMDVTSRHNPSQTDADERASRIAMVGRPSYSRLGNDGVVNGAANDNNTTGEQVLDVAGHGLVDNGVVVDREREMADEQRSVYSLPSAQATILLGRTTSTVTTAAAGVHYEVQRQVRRSSRAGLETGTSEAGVVRVAESCAPDHTVATSAAAMEEVTDHNGAPQAVSPAISRADLPALERADSAAAQRQSSEISRLSQGSTREYASPKRRRLSSECAE